MTITIQDYTNNISNAKIHMLTCSFELLTYLLGDWLLYNELVSYKDTNFLDLSIGTKVHDDNILTITIWVNHEFVRDIQVKDNGNDLIYKLEQIYDGVTIIETKGGDN